MAVLKGKNAIVTGAAVGLGRAYATALAAQGVNVAVCDGFVGNVVLKTSEAVAKMISSWLRRMFHSSTIRKIGGFLAKGVFAEMKAHADPASYGGAPLLGTPGRELPKVVHAKPRKPRTASCAQRRLRRTSANQITTFHGGNNVTGHRL